MATVIIIPARLGSSRLPDKLLLPAGPAGKTILQHTYEAACRCSLADAVYVASDGSEKIAVAVAEFGGKLLATSPCHANGALRVAEAARQLASDGPLRSRLNENSIVINWQADEPEADPAAVDAMIRQLASILASEIVSGGQYPPDRRTHPRIWTIAAPFPLASESQAWATDPNIVKVAVASGRGRALYFSRSMFLSASRHVGVYGFMFDALMHLPGMPPSELARAEDLEQLQWLEAGEKIGAVMTSHANGAINTRWDYEAFCRRLIERSAEAADRT